MNEPLTTSRPGISFSGKTYNYHPQWHNQPLRLTKEQKSDPLLVLDDFFECYHLDDVREILWQWLTEVLSSQHSIASESLDRNSHIFFYEMVEAIIEAAYVMRRKIHKHRRKQEKRRLKRIHQPEKNQSFNEKLKSDMTKPIFDSVINEDTFNKPKELIEYVSENPTYVITEVFKTYDWRENEPLAILRDQLQDWLIVAISADTAFYEEGEQRRQLLSFKDHLVILVEALYTVYKHQKVKDQTDVEINQADKTTVLLSQEQIANPMLVVASFFKKFPMVYIIRELNNWLEAAICYGGTFPENMSQIDALYTHRNMLCLIKSANRLLHQ